MISAVANHLWQSTLFALVTGLLAIVLQRNRAAVRYRLWLAASVKFLIPFSWLVGLGTLLGWRTAPMTAPSDFSIAVQQVWIPRAFQAAAPASVPGTASAGVIWALLVSAWAIGVIAVLVSWWQHWRPIRAAVRQARPFGFDPLSLTARMNVLFSPDLLEPGIVGIRRPVLLLPEGIADRLTPAQLRAILAHEECHVRRRDNLAAVIHMLVEAVYWFHPLVWWLETRLVDERERACDEEVLRLGYEPNVYAEGILTVCRFYTESPLVCASGVTGSDLKKRIETIMSYDHGKKLNAWKKFLIAIAGTVTVALPVAMGTLNAPLRAQSPATKVNDQVFEVASVKPNKSRAGQRDGNLAGGRLTMTYATLRDLVLFAYPRQDGHPRNDSQISGGPAWFDSDHFDVVAKAEGLPTSLNARDTAAGEATSAERTGIERVRLMLRTLLADRFRLTAHTEFRELPIYALVTARNDGTLGPQLHKVDLDCAALRNGGRTLPPVGPGGVGCGGFRGFGPGHYAGHAVPMSMIAGLLGEPVGRNVFDRTGLAGVFDMELQWTPDQPQRSGGPELTPGDLNGPSIFTAVREQLGLRLESAKAPVDVLVIDHAEQATEN